MTGTNGHGAPPVPEIVITLDPATRRIRMKSTIAKTGPESDRMMLNMLTSAIGILFASVGEDGKDGGPERQVKTLDELGVNPRFRI